MPRGEIDVCIPSARLHLLMCLRAPSLPRMQLHHRRSRLPKYYEQKISAPKFRLDFTLPSRFSPTVSGTRQLHKSPRSSSNLTAIAISVTSRAMADNGEHLVNAIQRQLVVSDKPPISSFPLPRELHDEIYSYLLKNVKSGHTYHFHTNILAVNHTCNK